MPLTRTATFTCESSRCRSFSRRVWARRQLAAVYVVLRGKSDECRVVVTRGVERHAEEGGLLEQVRVQLLLYLRQAVCLQRAGDAAANEEEAEQQGAI